MDKKSVDPVRPADDGALLAEYLARKEAAFEAICARCGLCCGAEGDRCIHLCGDKAGEYYCDVYAERLRPQVTVAGVKFCCRAMHDMLREGGPPTIRCRYVGIKEEA